MRKKGWKRDSVYIYQHIGGLTNLFLAAYFKKPNINAEPILTRRVAFTQLRLTLRYKED
jgi:hypothetical protein